MNISERITNHELRITNYSTGGEGGTPVIVQRFRSDKFFNSSQQIRLRKLMDKFHNAVKEGESLLPEEMAELEALVNSEYQGAAERAAVILRESSHRNFH